MGIKNSINVNVDNYFNMFMENELENDTVFTESQLNFVDLAGSEKISNHHIMMEETLQKNDE